MVSTIILFRIIFLTGMLWLLFPLLSYSADVSIAEQAHMIVKTVEKYHYAPRAVDDGYSAQVFKTFFNITDPYGVVYTREQMEKLAAHEHSLDDQIRNKETGFLDDVTALYEKQLRAILEIIQGYKEKDIAFNAADTLWLGGDNVYSTAKDFAGRWDRWIRYRVLYMYQAEDDSVKPVFGASNQHNRAFLDDIIARETCRITARTDDTAELKKHLALAYLRSVSTAFDPHTVYMSAEERRLFETSLSKKTGSFGINIGFNQIGETEIAEVVPGGPAWRSNKINEKDVILDVVKEDGTRLDLRCASNAQIHTFLASIGGEETEFKIRKADGSVTAVVLRKEVFDVEENTIRSYLLTGTRRVGYIYLPSFYGDFNYYDAFNRGCANDFAKELIKLKKDNIEGLILDLESNGGGTLKEALRLAGGFVNKGALSIQHARDTKPKTLKDKARGTIYRGPLVIMVNSASASASELLAAVMQDYKRAVIVGSGTYGKGTVQNILPVDAGKFDSLALYEGEPAGFLKITTGAFYRVTGESHQKTGVIPDVPLPSYADGKKTGEEAAPAALAFEKIDKKTYYYPGKDLPLDRLREKSAARIADNEGLRYVRDMAPDIPGPDTRYGVPLGFKAFGEFYRIYRARGDTLAADNYAFDISLPGYMTAHDARTTRDKERDTEIMEQINKNARVNEAYRILDDFIAIEKGKD